MNRLIIGCGYVGSEVARNWLASGDSVYAITRSSRRVDELTGLGVYPIVWDWYRPIDEQSNALTLPTIDSVVVCASHASVAGIDPSQTHTLGLDNLIQYWQDQSDSEFPSTWCYISTTGVYAPRDDGGWVDECSEVTATRPGAIAAKYAEEWFDREIFSRCTSSEASDGSWNGCILRAAGIYGPGRVPRLESLVNHEALAIDPDSYLNLIHVVDLARIVITACQGLGPHRLYNVADGNPVRRRDYYEYIAGQIGCLPPRFELSAESRVGRARGEGSKRVNTARLQDKLECSLQFPTYREGLGPLLRK